MRRRISGYRHAFDNDERTRMMNRTLLFIAIVVLTGTAGEMLASYVMKQVGEPESFSLRNLLSLLRRTLRLPAMWTSIGLMAAAFFAFLAVLSWADVSFVVPATAANYIVGALGAKLLLGERVTRKRWTGVLLVAAGVALTCMS
jgi:drug/metabolite transporter (DMT)-like permease